MISIVIPTLNEVKHLQGTIAHTIKSALNESELEIIVVDAGSTDETLASIDGMPLKSFSKPEFVFKKYKSLNFGVHHSSGDIVLFLDADTLLPKHFDQKVIQAMSDENVAGGAFEFSFLKPDWKLAIVTIFNRIRYRLGSIYYGDQAVFARRSVLDKIGGVPANALMETAYLCKRLQWEGKLRLIKQPIKTSPRRFNEYGFFKIVWFDINMFIRFNLGFPVSNYAEQYWSKNLNNR